jgi:hypothetical protein
MARAGGRSLIIDRSWDVVGVADRYRTGRDLPQQFGPWQTMWKRHHRFATDRACACRRPASDDGRT